MLFSSCKTEARSRLFGILRQFLLLYLISSHSDTQGARPFSDRRSCSPIESQFDLPDIRLCKQLLGRFTEAGTSGCSKGACCEEAERFRQARCQCWSGFSDSDLKPAEGLQSRCTEPHGLADASAADTEAAAAAADAGTFDGAQAASETDELDATMLGRRIPILGRGSQTAEREMAAEEPVRLFVGVLTSGKNTEARAAVRSTWGKNPRLHRVVFFAAKPREPQVFEELRKEAAAEGDVVMLPNVWEGYYNITHQTLEVCRAAALHPQATHTMKVDDDAYVRVERLLKKLAVAPRQHMFMGSMERPGGGPNREVGHEWYVPEEEWPSDTYPPWAHGVGYVLTQDLVQQIAAGAAMAASDHKLLRLEDVAMGSWIQFVGQDKGWDVALRHDRGFNFGGCRGNAIALAGTGAKKLFAVCCSQLEGPAAAFAEGWTRPARATGQEADVLLVHCRTRLRDLLSGSHKQMSPQHLLAAIEDIYQGLTILLPQCSWTRPQRWIEDDVCQNLDGYLHAKKAGKADDIKGDQMRFLLHIRHAYRQLHGKPTALDSGREPARPPSEPILLLVLERSAAALRSAGDCEAFVDYQLTGGPADADLHNPFEVASQAALALHPDKLSSLQLRGERYVHLLYARKAVNTIHEAVRLSKCTGVSKQPCWMILRQLSQFLQKEDLDPEAAVEGIQVVVHALIRIAPQEIKVPQDPQACLASATPQPANPQSQDEQFPLPAARKSSSQRSVSDISSRSGSPKQSASAPGSIRVDGRGLVASQSPIVSLSASVEDEPKQGSGEDVSNGDASNGHISLPSFLLWNNSDASDRECMDVRSLAGTLVDENKPIAHASIQCQTARQQLRHAKAAELKSHQLVAAAVLYAAEAATGQALRAKMAQRKQAEEAWKARMSQNTALLTHDSKFAAAEAQALAAANQLLQDEEKSARAASAKKEAKQRKQAQRRARDQAKHAQSKEVNKLPAAAAAELSHAHHNSIQENLISTIPAPQSQLKGILPVALQSTTSPEACAAMLERTAIDDLSGKPLRGCEADASPAEQFSLSSPEAPLQADKRAAHAEVCSRMHAARGALQRLGPAHAAVTCVPEARQSAGDNDPDDDNTCIICLDQPACVAFKPCSHCVTCTACAELVVQAKQPCPLCRSSAVSIMP
ncbi:hypothetical protein WJX74_009677 [Apatococcus lobatus]|uniref:RING-type domain-containing protein n=1 Tax=Apatococcus lobatus TaxID=904363 RepID=A0AAW1Q9Y1_9CHLO